MAFRDSRATSVASSEGCFSEELIQRDAQLSPRGMTATTGEPAPATRARVIDLTGSHTALPASSRQNSALSENFDRAFKGMEEFLIRVNFIDSYQTRESKVLLVICALAAIVSVSISVAILVLSYTNLRELRVSNPFGVCDAMPYEEVKTNTIAFGVANIIVGSVFAFWFAWRAVRLEKGGLLLGMVLVSVLAVARQMYLILSPDLATTMGAIATLSARILFPVSSVLHLAGCAMAIPASNKFGWRLYSKGVTQAHDVETMKRQRQMDAASKFDLYITVIVFVTIFFMVDQQAMRIYGFIVVVVTIVYLLGLSYIIRRRWYFVLYSFVLVCVLMPVFYIYTTVTLMQRPPSKCAEDMHGTLLESNITVLNTTLDATDAQCLAQLAVSGEVAPSALLSGLCFVSRTSPSYPLCVCGSCISYAPSANGSSPSAAVLTTTTTMTPSAGGPTSCVSLVNATYAATCNEFGRCTLKQRFFADDQYVFFIIAGLGIICRVVTLILAFRQMAMMDLPGVQEMLARGERNIKGFTLTLPNAVTSLKSKKPSAASSDSSPAKTVN
mgnify:CR=1 FL=1